MSDKPPQPGHYEVFLSVEDGEPGPDPIALALERAGMKVICVVGPPSVPPPASSFAPSRPLPTSPEPPNGPGFSLAPGESPGAHGGG